VVGGRRLPLVQRHPQRPSHEVPAGKRRFAISRTDQSRLQGRLVACEHDSRRVTRQEADGSITVVANSTLSLLADDFVLPNGLAFSPDESVLYINDTRRGHIRAFELLPSGMLAKHTDRVFADLRGPEPGVPDGMKVDVEGNVYCGGAGGIWVMDPAGKKLGRIVHGAPATTNLAFGGDDWRTLYITSRNHLGAVKVKIPGIAVPVAAK
jgi:gluconolactonase